MQTLRGIGLTALLVFLLSYLVGSYTLPAKTRDDGLLAKVDGIGLELSMDSPWRGTLVVVDELPNSVRLRSTSAAERTFRVDRITTVEVDSKPVPPEELVPGDTATVYFREEAGLPVATRILVRR